MRGNRMFVISALVIGTILTVVLAYDRATDPTHWVAVVEELRVPTSWTTADLHVNRSFLFGTRASRYYLVDLDPQAVKETVKTIVGSAGFELDSQRATGCSQNGNTHQGPFTCTLAAMRGQDHLWIVIYDRGEMAVYYVDGAQRQLQAPSRSVLRITAGDWY